MTLYLRIEGWGVEKSGKLFSEYEVFGGDAENGTRDGCAPQGRFGAPMPLPRYSAELHPRAWAARISKANKSV